MESGGGTFEGDVANYLSRKVQTFVVVGTRVSAVPWLAALYLAFNETVAKESQSEKKNNVVRQEIHWSNVVFFIFFSMT